MHGSQARVDLLDIVAQVRVPQGVVPEEVVAHDHGGSAMDACAGSPKFARPQTGGSETGNETRGISKTAEESVSQTQRISGEAPQTQAGEGAPLRRKLEAKAHPARHG